jgi:ADP-ribose pyrophosphatase
MSEAWPRIKSRRATKISPWIEVIEREVEFAAGEAPQLYHAVGQNDYIGIVALTPSKQIPIVRQYRPAIEGFTWELPAGLVDAGEDAAESCKRELLEETGYPALAVHPLGVAFPCTGRLSNRIHSFFVETGERIESFKPERGLDVKLVSQSELARLITAGKFPSQLHLGTLLLAVMRSFVKLEP